MLFRSGSYVVRLRTSGPGGSATDSALVQFNNAPPAAGISGPSSENRGQAAPFVLTAADPSPLDQTVGFTFQIDWDGDGIADQTAAATSGAVVSHTYAVAGVYNVRVTATDKDGGVSAVATTSIRIDRGSLNPLGTESAINATTTGDQTAPAVANDLFGNYVVAWVDSAKDGVGGGSGVYARVLNNTGGVVVPEFRVNTTLVSNQDQPAVAMNANGQFVVV